MHISFEIFFSFATVKVPQIANKTLDNVFLCTLQNFFGKFLYNGIFLRGLGRGYDVFIQKQWEPTFTMRPFVTIREAALCEGRL